MQLQQSMPLPNLGMNRMIIQNIVHDYVRMCNSIDNRLGLYTLIHASSCPVKDVVRDFDGRLPISLCFQYIGVHVGLPMTIVPVRHFRILGQFWSVLWSLRDTNLERSTMYCPHVIGKTWVVSRTVI